MNRELKANRALHLNVEDWFKERYPAIAVFDKSHCSVHVQRDDDEYQYMIINSPGKPKTHLHIQVCTNDRSYWVIGFWLPSDGNAYWSRYAAGKWKIHHRNLRPACDLTRDGLGYLLEKIA
jgi:hypothetical protein